jgi:hypothetical protein
MANPEHVELVKQGMEAIRKWREENPDVRPDLSEVDLGKTDLSGAFLSRADLAGVGGAEHAYHLENIRFISADDSQGSDSGNDAHYLRPAAALGLSAGSTGNACGSGGVCPSSVSPTLPSSSSPSSSTAWRSTTIRSS